MTSSPPPTSDQNAAGWSDRLEALLKQGQHDKVRNSLTTLTDPAATTAEHFLLARAFRAAGRLEDASRAYEHCLRLDPKHIDARVQLAQIEFASGHADRAFDILEKGTELRPNCRPFRFAACSYRFQTDPSPENLGQIEEFVGAYPNFGPGLIFLRQSYQAIGDKLQADKIRPALKKGAPKSTRLTELTIQRLLTKRETQKARELLATLPDSPDSYLLLARSWALDANLDQIRLIIRQLQNRPVNAQHAFCEGRLHLLLNNRDAGEKCFRQALSFNPLLHAARLALAQLLVSQDALTRALQEIENGLAATPDVWLLRHEWISMRQMIDQESVAPSEFQSLIAAAPHKPMGYRLYLSWLMKQELYSETESLIRDFADHCPNHCNSDLETGSVALECGQVDTALKFFNAGNAARSDDPEVLLHYARALRANEDEQGLTDLLEHVREIAGDEAQENRNLDPVIGRILQFLNRYDEALQHYEEMSKQNPGSVSSLLVWTNLLTLLGKGDQAATALAQASELLGENPTVVAHRARAEQGIGRFQQGAEILNSAKRSTAYQIRNLRAIQKAQTGDLSGALEDLEDWQPQGAIEKARKHMAVARVLWFRFDLDRVLQNCDAALALAPRFPDAKSLRARARLLSLDPVAALQDLQDANALQRKAGQPVRKSRQGIDGQLINEMLLSLDLVQALAVARNQPDRVNRTAALAKSNPDNTAAGIALLMVMRQAGLLDQHRPPSDVHNPPAKIAHNIFQYWEDGNPPADVAAAMAQLERHNPWAQYRCFDLHAAQDYVARHGSPQTQRAFRLCRHAAERADVLRLLVLSCEGGIYVDVDDLCCGDLCDVLPKDATLVLYQEDIGSTGNNFIAAAAGNPVLTDALNEISQALLQGATESIWLRTGPGALTRAFARAIAQTQPPALPKGYHLLPRMSLYRRLVMCRPFSYKIDNRHWSKAEARHKTL